MRLNQLPGDLVCFDDVGPFFFKDPGDRCLAAGHSSRHSNDEHPSSSKNWVQVKAQKLIINRLNLNLNLNLSD
jgi:hypothetical protein